MHSGRCIRHNWNRNLQIHQCKLFHRSILTQIQQCFFQRRQQSFKLLKTSNALYQTVKAFDFRLKLYDRLLISAGLFHELFCSLLNLNAIVSLLTTISISQHFSCSWKMQFGWFVCFCTENNPKLCSSPKVHANLECLELPNIIFFSCQRFCDCCVAKIFIYRDLLARRESC